jgi:hypothetical protein
MESEVATFADHIAYIVDVAVTVKESPGEYRVPNPFARVFQPLNPKLVFFKFPELAESDMTVPESTVIAAGAVPELEKLDE